MSDTPTPAVPPEVLQTFSDALAQSIAAQSGQPVEALVEGATIAGGFTLKITHDKTVYSLVISVPSKPGDPYKFEVTMTKPGKDPDKPVVSNLAVFNFTDAENWSVVVSTPEIPAGPVTINELSLNISSTGSPKSPPEVDRTT